MRSSTDRLARVVMVLVVTALGVGCRTDKPAERSAPADAAAAKTSVSEPRPRPRVRPRPSVRKTPRRPRPYLRKVRAVTAAGTLYLRPRWTPDGRRIAVTHRRFDGIHLVDPKTGRVETVTQGTGAGYAYDWSPDGRRIAYRTLGTAGGRRRWTIEVYDLRTRRKAVLVTASRALGFPVFGPRGTQVLYTDSSALWQVAVGGGKPRRRAGGFAGRRVLWLRGRGRLLLNEDRAVVALAPDGGRRKVHFQGSGFFGLVAAPGGKRYLVHESRGREGHLWVYDLVAQRRRDLGVGYSGTFLPKTDWVVFGRNRNDGRRFTAGELWAVTLDGRARVRLTDTTDRVESSPSASPDGRRLAFTDARTGILYSCTVEVR